LSVVASGRMAKNQINFFGIEMLIYKPTTAPHFIRVCL
jgi:hypothetical protein